MSKRSKSKLRVAVKAVALPEVLCFAQAGGEVVSAFNGSTEEVATAQLGLSKGWIAEILVFGIGSDGSARDQISMTFQSGQGADVTLDLDGGRRSAVEAICGGLGRSIQYAVERMRRRSLTPRIQFRFHDEIYADPDRLAACRAELGTTECEAPGWRSGYTGRRVVSVTPAKTNGRQRLDLLQEFFGAEEN